MWLKAAKWTVKIWKISINEENYIGILSDSMSYNNNNNNSSN